MDRHKYSGHVLVLGFPTGPLQANCYVVAGDRGGQALVIDPGDDAAEQLGQVLREHELHCAAVLLTHGHLDHCGSAAEFADPLGITAHLHPADEYMLDDPLASLSPVLRSLVADRDFSGLRPAAVATLATGVVMDLADLRVGVDASPGHTGGSVIFRIAGSAAHPDLLFTGDTLFAGSIGRTDLPGGSSVQIRESLTALLRHADSAVVLPGHGRTSTIGAERAGNPYLPFRASS